MGNERPKPAGDQTEPQPGELIKTFKTFKISRTGSMMKEPVFSLQPDPNLQMDARKVEKLRQLINSQPHNHNMRKNSRSTRGR